MSFRLRWIKKGTTPEKPKWLDRYTIPSFMKIDGHYRVVVGPDCTGPDVVGGNLFLYGVRDRYEKGPIWYFQCTLENLPKEFWIRMIQAPHRYYEFVPYDEPCEQ